MATPQPQDIPNDPACDAGQTMKQVSYQQQYSRVLDDTAPLQGVDGDIACEIAGLEQNATKNQYGSVQRYHFDPDEVMRG